MFASCTHLFEVPCFSNAFGAGRISPGDGNAHGEHVYGPRRQDGHAAVDSSPVVPQGVHSVLRHFDHIACCSRIKTEALILVSGWRRGGSGGCARELTLSVCHEVNRDVESLSSSGNAKLQQRDILRRDELGRRTVRVAVSLVSEILRCCVIPFTGKVLVLCLPTVHQLKSKGLLVLVEFVCCENKRKPKRRFVEPYVSHL